MGHGSHQHRHGPIEGRRHTRSYDWMARHLMRRTYRRIAADLAEAAPAGSSVLDIGTGPGVLLDELHRLRPDLRLTGVDLSEDMVEIAERNLARIEGAEVRTADVAALPFEADRFDLVASSFSAHHWEDPESGAAEIARVLRPGGRLLIYDFDFAPYDAFDGPGLGRVGKGRFRTGWGPFFKCNRFEAAAA